MDEEVVECVFTNYTLPEIKEEPRKVPEKISDLIDDTIAVPLKRASNADNVSFKKISNEEIDNMFENE